MKNMVLILSIPLAFVGIVLATSSYFEYLENPKSEFATFEEMESAGLISRGWLPEYFPKSATRIREGHNIDTNRVWAAFKYDRSDVKSMEEVCQKIAESNAGSKYLCPPYDSRTSTMIFRNDGEAYYLSYDNGI
ncbi:MAG: hypothetical protein OEU56_23290 [Rhodospirillales bacterium]|nr:hypothetical protein [Rhodospirillales bacterium]